MTDNEIKPALGRPAIYTPELADVICDRLSNGESLRSVCRDPLMPDKKTVLKWLRNDEEFVAQYARAKEEAADALVDEMIEIADDGSNDLMVITKGQIEYEVENKEVTNRSKLRVETRKWISSKLKPKKYGDHLDVTSGGHRLTQEPIIMPNIIPRDVATQA